MGQMGQIASGANLLSFGKNGVSGISQHIDSTVILYK
jgi:hypothetical protein